MKRWRFCGASHPGIFLGFSVLQRSRTSWLQIPIVFPDPQQQQKKNTHYIDVFFKKWRIQIVVLLVCLKWQIHCMKRWNHDMLSGYTGCHDDVTFCLHWRIHWGPHCPHCHHDMFAPTLDVTLKSRYDIRSKFMEVKVVCCLNFEHGTESQKRIKHSRRNDDMIRHACL